MRDGHERASRCAAFARLAPMLRLLTHAPRPRPAPAARTGTETKEGTHPPARGDVQGGRAERLYRWEASGPRTRPPAHLSSRIRLMPGLPRNAPAVPGGPCPDAITCILLSLRRGKGSRMSCSSTADMILQGCTSELDASHIHEFSGERTFESQAALSAQRGPQRLPKRRPGPGAKTRWTSAAVTAPLSEVRHKRVP